MLMLKPISSIWLILFFIFSGTIKAQSDTTFWFAVPEVTQRHADRPIRLVLSANYESNVTISIPANESIEPIEVRIPQGQSHVEDLTTWINELECEPNKVENKGLLIRSDQKITAYFENLGIESWQGSVNADIATLKGNNALGTTFVIPFQNQFDVFPGLDAYASMNVVATEDDTYVTIVEKGGTILDYDNDEPGNNRVVLDRGQTYSWRVKYQLASTYPSGTHISSNKKIAITTEDDSAYDPPSYDLIMDQITPVSQWDTTAFLTGGAYVTVVSHEDSVDVYILDDTLSLGPFDSRTYALTQLTSDDPIVLKSVSPVGVFLLQRVGKEYGGAMIPGFSCGGSNQVRFSRSTDQEIYLQLWVKEKGTEGFTINGKPISLQNRTKPVGDTEWRYANLRADSLSQGRIHEIRNTLSRFHFALLRGTSTTGASFGFFSSFSGLSLDAPNLVCRTDTTITLDAGQDWTTYQWSTGSTEQSITVNQSGTYSLRVQQGTCEAEDSISIVFSDKPFVDFPDDTTLCPKENFTVELPSDYSYVWFDGNQSSSRVLDTAREYGVRIQNSAGCTVEDSMQLQYYRYPIFYPLQDTILCRDESWTVFVENENVSAIKWYRNGEMESEQHVFEIAQPGNYQVTVESLCLDTTIFFQVEQWELSIPNVITPNGDHKNDRFVISGLQDKKWQFEVFNRWGKRVYRNDFYQNDWSAENLEEGTYFYSLQQESRCNRFSGWIYLKR
jgi:gliding motility-associated-like protein